jgi:uncharacterized protein involved in type VI secretion and phage assembly
MSGPVLAKGRFAVAEWWRAGVHIGIVTSVKDPNSKGRVQVKIPAIDADGEAKIWARVALPYAGDNFGAFFVPDVGTEVLIAFVAGDPGSPVVIGNLWNGSTGVPESLPGDSVDRWTLTGKNGTRIAIVEAGKGQEKVEIEMPSGSVSATLTDSGGGQIKLTAGGSTIKLSPSGVSISTPGAFNIQASSMTVNAPTVTFNSATATFSLAVNATMISTVSLSSAIYSMGLGNIW